MGQPFLRIRLMELPCFASRCIPVTTICNFRWLCLRIASSVERIRPNSAREPVTKQIRREDRVDLRGIGEELPGEHFAGLDGMADALSDDGRERRCGNARSRPLDAEVVFLDAMAGGEIARGDEALTADGGRTSRSMSRTFFPAWPRI